MSEMKRSALGVAVVTGASSGLGKVYADRLAQRGYDLLLVARRGDRLKAIGAEIEAKHGVNVESFVADLSDAAGIEATAKRLAGDASITLLVNNAGTSNIEPVAEVSATTLTKMITLNVTSLTLLTQAVLPGFLARNAGTIINIGSVVSFAGYAMVPVYGGTKAYVMNFTQALKQQIAESAVRLQYVAPSGTVSEIWDVMGLPKEALGDMPLMDTDECVDAALAGLDAGEFITAPSVHHAELVKAFEETSMKLLMASQVSTSAQRYRVK
ncbi:SDR family NAD(P)-dependent oxidoreductase [Granulicella cerasi]|uniref:SDR family NAD(P)-dependent oxidoreductase n=1 Tax=Granulicella cerasi TaxID=741063 RepID=A0ABW1Z8Q9_9BACT|nr:SDR family NAD(P)-dependent oxidoreductase [Granulicella cerasi]